MHNSYFQQCLAPEKGEFCENSCSTDLFNNHRVRTNFHFCGFQPDLSTELRMEKY